MKIRLAIAAVFAAMVSLLTLTGTASASAPGTVYFNVPVRHLGDGSLLIQLPENKNAGDCTLYAGSNVRVSYPDLNRNVLVTWSGTGQTSHTNNGDIWHLALFSNAFGPANAPALFSTPLMDSDLMRNAHTTYTWQRPIAVHVPNGVVFENITTTLWQNIC